MDCLTAGLEGGWRLSYLLHNPWLSWVVVAKDAESSGRSKSSIWVAATKTGRVFYCFSALIIEFDFLIFEGTGQDGGGYG